MNASFERSGFGLHLPAVPEKISLISPDAADLRLRPSPFSTAVHTARLTSGASLLFGMRQACRECGLPPRILKHARVFINGAPVPREEWSVRRIHKDDFISVAVPLQGGGGGKNPLATILQIAVIMAAAVTGGWIAAGGLVKLGLAATWFTAGSASALALGAAASAGIMMGGMLLANAIAPASLPKLTQGDTERAARVWSIEGTQNRLDPYGAYPLVLGRVRWSPRLGAMPYTVLNGNDQYVRYLYVVSMGSVQVEDPRIGDTPFAYFQGSRMIVHQNWQGGSLTFFDRAVHEESFSVVLTHAAGWQTRTTKRDATHAQLFFTFPRGLKGIWDDGTALTLYLGVLAAYRKVGTTEWTISPHNFSGKTVTAQRRGILLTFPEPGQYEVGAFRFTEDHDLNDAKFTWLDETVWSGMQSWTQAKALVYQNRPLTLIEIELKATDQLSGNVDEFNILATSVAPTWNGSAWTGAPTNNPASLGLLVATSQATGKPAKWEDMDVPAWAEFYAWCAKWGFAYNAVQTSRTTAGELLHNILAAGRGSYAHRGAHSIVWDDPDAPVVELLTPRNAWGFRALKTLLKERVHGLRIRFLNQDKDFQEDERIVYADGYAEANATNIIEWEQDGVTDPNLIYMHGRLRLAEIQLRPETYELSAEAEALTIRRGDKVRSQHDVTLWGIQSGRVMRRIMEEEASSSQARVAAIEIDEEIHMEAGKEYGVRVSSPASPDAYYAVETVPGYTGRILRFLMPPSVETAPDFDDLVAFGLTGRETQTLNVLSVTPGDNLTAQITLQDAAPEIYQAISGPVPPWNSNITIPTRYDKGKPPTPEIISVISDETVLIRQPNGSTMPRIAVNFYQPAGTAENTAESMTLHIRPHGGNEPWRVAATGPVDARTIYAQDVTELSFYDLRLSSVSRSGVLSEYSPVATHKVVGRTTPPPAPDMVYLDGYNLGIRLADRPLDVVGFEVWMAFDAADGFAMALKISDPYTPDGKFDLTPWAGHARRVFVRTVDELGLVSETRDVLIEFGDMQPQNIILEYSQKERMWPGEIKNGHTGARNRLYASDSTFLFPTDPDAFVFPSDARVPVFPTANGAAMAYTFHVQIPPEAAGARVLIQPDIIRGKTRSIEFRQYAIPYVFPSEPDAYVFPSDPDAPVFPVLVIGEWEAAPTNYITPGNEWMDIRITFAPGSDAAVIDDIRLTLDVQDRVYKADSILVPASGARLPIPEGYFRHILNVTYGMENGEGLTALYPLTLDKNGGRRDENGYLLEGPLVAGIDATGNKTAVQVDAVISGY